MPTYGAGLGHALRAFHFRKQIMAQNKPKTDLSVYTIQ